MTKRIVLFIMAAEMFLFGLCFPRVSVGIEFPARGLQIVVPFPPGGSIDIVPRILSPRLAEHLGKPVSMAVNVPYLLNECRKEKWHR